VGTIAWIDWLVIVLYFVVLIGIVWWSSRRQDTPADYFLAGRNVGFFAIGCSLFASNIGSEHIIGLAGAGAASGMGYAHYELHAWIMILLAWVFVPFYYRTAVYTMPEFLERRFGPNVRWVLSIISLVAYVLTKVSVSVYAGAVLFQALLPEAFGGLASALHQAMPWLIGEAFGAREAAFWIGAFVTVILTGLYTIFGGLRAVLYTDSVQAIILIAGATAITFIGLYTLGEGSVLGGWGELQQFATGKKGDFALWRSIDDPSLPWLGILIGSPIVGIWYWCTDQYIVQRTLSAKSLTSSRRGALFGGILKVWPVLIFLVPGMVGAALDQRGVISIPEKAGGGFQADQIFPIMVTDLLPIGLRGLVVAGVLAALMSSLSSLFNSTASLFTVDIYEKIRPGRSERHLVRVGRIVTAVVVVAGLLWIPVLTAIGDEGLYNYLQTVQGYMAPPITAVFLLGLLWRRMNATGAMWGLLAGIALGLGKLAIETFYGSAEGKYDDPAWLAWIGDFNFLYFSSVLFPICIGIIAITSLATKPPTPEKVRGLSFGSLTAAERSEIRESWNWVDIAMTVGVLALVLGMYLYFSFWL
jgi:SSS family solute:Na+ symporter